MVQKGLDGIVVDTTALSRVDGLAGELVYRGYNIDEVAQCSFEEICCLFLYGDLPTASQLEEFETKLKAERVVPKPVLDYVVACPKSEQPMAVLRTAVSMLSSYMPTVEDLSAASLHAQAIALMSKVSTIAAAIARVRMGLAPVAPDLNLTHAANYLYMSTGTKQPDVIAKTLDTALVLHADHGFNASTFTARVTVSSLSDMVSGITAAIGSLKGPLHGGANTAVMEMLMEIGDLENVVPWIENALANKKKVMGFGHRVYKTLDPRAKHLKRMSKEWGERVGNVKWFMMSEKIEEIMKAKKNIDANVDFYSASTYYAMGIQPELFTVIFAVARTIGWAAHIMEQLADNRIVRPEAEYTGPEAKRYKLIRDR